MGFKLTHDVTKALKFYKGEAITLKDDRAFNFTSYILATSADAALFKFRDVVFQEHPSSDSNKTQFRITVDSVIL